jgi:ABC-type amino acid transport substrate-binding protein
LSSASRPDEPNSFVDPKTREIVGYDVDLAKAIAKKLGVKLTLKQLAVAARIPELQGRVDLLAASLTHNKDREAKIDFSLTTFVTGQKVLVRKDSNITSRAAIGRQEGADGERRDAGAEPAQGRSDRRGGDVRDHRSGFCRSAARQGRRLRQRRGVHPR